MNLRSLPNWVLDNSDFLRTLFENEEKDNNELCYIPFLTCYDESYDFGDLFQKDKPYLNLDRFLIIYYDGLIFLDFIGFQIEFYQLIEPKFYQNELIYEHQEDLKERTIGVQHYALRFRDFGNTFQHLQSEFLIERKFVSTILANHHDWILWFIRILENYDHENAIINYIEQIFTMNENEDFTRMSVETFDFIKTKLFIKPFHYPKICEMIIKSYHIPLFEKYHIELKNAYEEEVLLQHAFSGKIKDAQLPFIQKMFEKGYKFYRGDHSLVQALFSSNHVEIYNYIHTTFYDQVKYVVAPIHKKLYELAIKNLSKDVSFQEKCALCDFFIEKYPTVTQSNSFIKSTFINNDMYNHQNDDFYDKEFITYVIKKTNHLYERNTYLLSIVLKMQHFMNDYHTYYYNPNTNCYHLTAFRDYFRIIIRSGIYENINFYIQNELYRNDTDNYKQYLEYALYNHHVFKYLYDKGFRNINDALIQEAFQERSIETISFLVQHTKYKCTPEVIAYMKNELKKMENIRELLYKKKESVDVIQINFDESHYQDKKRIYEIVSK
jgi:hypothetical protein